MSKKKLANSKRWRFRTIFEIKYLYFLKKKNSIIF